MTLTGQQQEEESSLDDVGVMDFRNKLRRCVELNKKETGKLINLFINYTFFLYFHIYFCRYHYCVLIDIVLNHHT